MSNNFKATKKLTLSLFGMYRSEREGLQFTNKHMYFVNTDLRYSLLDDAATFSFNYNDIFNTMKAGFVANAPYRQVGQFNWESNTWNIEFSYRFGGGKYRALQRKIWWRRHHVIHLSFKSADELIKKICYGYISQTRL